MSSSPKLLLLLLLFLVAGLASSGVTALGWGSAPAAPSESECRPYIEKALKELSAETTAQEAVDTTSGPETQATDTSKEDSKEDGSIEGKDGSITIESQEKDEGDKSGEEDGKESGESAEAEKSKEGEDKSVEDVSAAEEKSAEDKSAEDLSAEAQEGKSGEAEGTSTEAEGTSAEVEGKSDEVKSAETEENSGENKSEEKSAEEDEGTSAETGVGKEEESKESGEQDAPTKESAEDTAEESAEKESSNEKPLEADATSKEDVKSPEAKEDSGEGETTSKEESKEDTAAGSAGTVGTEGSEEQTSAETTASEEKSAEGEDKSGEGLEEKHDASKESEEAANESGETTAKEESDETVEVEKSAEEKDDSGKSGESEEAASTDEEVKVESEEAGEKEDKSTESGEKVSEDEQKDEEPKEEGAETAEGAESEEEAAPEEELTMEIYIPEKLRSRGHIAQILKLDEESAEAENLLSKSIDITLRDLKRLYDSAIKPLEVLYKYRDLSNRHFGDPEIFSKPLVLFMGPWSGGKSTIINYLLDNEYKKSALRTGAEPSPAYFNILMYGEQEEVLDGTQLAADWTFSGLQKFGQGLLDRLRGLKLNHPLLEKVNIVEIPGILEIRKQVERLFPFNDACQWFIDRADIIFLVYDPSKLDVGPETEAILDQLKGREYQTRIVLNKADQVKPEELMRVQGTLIWNISPLMSSSEPPIMYSTSLWSLPYETGAPTRLLQAQERAFLQDLRGAVDKRVENKIASARRFAVRVRNHAKMVDCYLTTYYNHKSFFGNRKKVADDITEHPQNYHIYEGLSTLTNISRYDLPDPEVYRDFFRLNPLYDFQQLSATCTYFRGCPINRLDVAIAYDLPELVGKYKKAAEAALTSDAGTETPPKS